ncbi:unnamed protein product [Cochlearia groenlandica]
MKTQSKKRKVPMSGDDEDEDDDEDDDSTFNLSSLKDVIDSTVTKTIISPKTIISSLDLSSLSHALSSVKRRMIRKDMFHQIRRERAITRSLASISNIGNFKTKEEEEEELFQDFNHLSDNKEPIQELLPLCVLNKQIDILYFPF